MHDPTSLFRFEEHDIFVPMMTLEELDNNKKGMSEVARNARQASRMLDEIVGGPRTHRGRHPLERPVRGWPPAACSCRPSHQRQPCRRPLPTAKADNQILARGDAPFREVRPKRAVILVSKDINMRIKARALGLAAQDYFNDKVLEDTDLLYTGTRELPAFWEANGKDMESWKQDGRTLYRIKGPLCPDLLINEFLFQDGEAPCRPSSREGAARRTVLETLIDYSHQKNACGASPRATASRTSPSTC
jgi:PhoH-like ATPase